MKKIISITLCLILAIGLFASPAYAQNISNSGKTDNEYIFYYKDGTYTTTRFISEPETRSSTVTKTKAVDYHNASGTILFSLYIQGTFSVNGSSVTCTSKKHWYEINNSAWSNSSVSSYISNNGSSASATANGTFKRKILGITVNTIDTSVTLNCDKNGNFS